MAPEQAMTPQSEALHLPNSVVTKVDVGRLLRELEQVDEFLHQSAVRAPGTPVKLPRTSRLFDEVVAENKLNLLQEADRTRLLTFVRQIQTSAPVMHISFSADPSPRFVQKLITWLRAEIHPIVLLQIGLQPNIGAGCVVRTTNKYFDLSLRSRFKDHRPDLAKLMQGSST